MRFQIKDPRHRDIKYFGIGSNPNIFFKSLKPGEVFAFSDGYSFKEVQSMGHRRNKTIIYCKPGTPEYKKYGCMTAKVALAEEVEPKIFHFDIEMLDV